MSSLKMSHTPNISIESIDKDNYDSPSNLEYPIFRQIRMNTKEYLNLNMPFPQCTPGLTLRKSKAHGSLERFFEINNWIGQRWEASLSSSSQHATGFRSKPREPPARSRASDEGGRLDIRTFIIIIAINIRGPAGLIEWLEFWPHTFCWNRT